VSMPERSLFLNDKPPVDNSGSGGKNKKKKKPGFFTKVGNGVSGTLNWFGFPVGQDDDIDSSLAADLPGPADDTDSKPAKKKKQKHHHGDQPAADASTSNAPSASASSPQPAATPASNN